MNFDSDNYPNLGFKRTKYQDVFDRGPGRMEPEVEQAYDELLKKCVGSSGLFKGRIVMGIRPYIMHLFDPNFPENRICWLVPTRHFIRIRLFEGTQIGTVLNKVTNPDMPGTPFPIEVQITSKKDVKTALAYIKDSAKRRNR
ncbi:MAG: hypothetical protein GY841_21780 [FCB group bacterium]|nr:hypothetical protein [FCB group bacterium]